MVSSNLDVWPFHHMYENIIIIYIYILKPVCTFPSSCLPGNAIENATPYCPVYFTIHTETAVEFTVLYVRYRGFSSACPIQRVQFCMSNPKSCFIFKDSQGHQGCLHPSTHYNIMHLPMQYYIRWLMRTVIGIVLM